MRAAPFTRQDFIDAPAGATIATALCRVCAKPLERVKHVDYRGDHDAFWRPADGSSLIGGPLGANESWDLLDRLRESDVARYSQTKAYQDVNTMFPWQHQHLPGEITYTLRS